MTPEQLKISILQYAFQGRLTEQLNTDSSVTELYENLLQETKRAITSGEIKKPKSLTPITEDDVIFDIPSSWMNIKLGEVSQLVDGEKKKGEEYNYLEVKYIRGNISPKKVKEG